MTDMKSFRLETIGREIDLIGTKINHFDGLRQKTRQMALVLWTATVGIGVKDEAALLFLLACLIPLPFWLIETTYRRYYTGWYGRLKAIREFIRDGQYEVLGKQPAATLTDFLSDEYDEEGFKGTRFPVFDYWGTGTVAASVRDSDGAFWANFFTGHSLILYFPMMLLGSLLFLLQSAM